MSSRGPRLPSGEVRFARDFPARLAALELRLAGALLRREGAGAGALIGGGEDLAGFRPYRPGEDLRQLDWNLLARLERPFVRVTRREAGERWAVALDRSASMGCGPPGKLQRAAECAAALAVLGARQGAEVELFVAGDEGEAPRRFPFRPREGTAALLAFLESLDAAGSAGLGALLEVPQRFHQAGRLFALGDLFDLELGQVAALRRGGRELCVLQLLSPEELDPSPGGVEWWDPEAGERLQLEVDGARLSRYHEALEARLEAWRRSAAAHRIRFACRSSATPFEELVRDLVEA